jgi:hypothetical protein
MTKKTISVYVEDLEEQIGGGTLYSVIEILKAYAEEYGYEATIQTGCVELYIHRLETDEEYEGRLERERKFEESRKKQTEQFEIGQRKLYDKLKKKYEG